MIRTVVVERSLIERLVLDIETMLNRWVADEYQQKVIGQDLDHLRGLLAPQVSLRGKRAAGRTTLPQAVLVTMGHETCLGRETFTAQRAATSTGSSVESVRAAISKLVAAGRLERVSLGEYRYIENPVERAQ